MVFLSTPSARRATFALAFGLLDFLHFYPRPPRGGRPCLWYTWGANQSNFYPRPPRGGRPGSCASKYFEAYFYPRPPRGGRQEEYGDTPAQRAISIHALREEGDSRSALYQKQLQKFLSTPSARRATAKTERKYSAFVSLYTSLHKLQRGLCKASRKITPLLAQSTVIPVRSIPENHVHCLFALAGHQKISTLSCANSGCSPTCSTLVW